MTAENPQTLPASSAPQGPGCSPPPPVSVMPRKPDIVGQGWAQMLAIIKPQSGLL